MRNQLFIIRVIVICYLVLGFLALQENGVGHGYVAHHSPLEGC